VPLQCLSAPENLENILRRMLVIKTPWIPRRCHVLANSVSRSHAIVRYSHVLRMREPRRNTSSVPASSSPKLTLFVAEIRSADLSLLAERVAAPNAHPIALCAVANRCIAYADTGGRAVCEDAVAAWLTRSEHPGRHDGRGAAAMLHALAKVRSKRLDLLEAVGRECIRQKHMFNVQEASTSFWAASSLSRVDGGAVARSLAATCASHARHFNAIEVSTSLLSLARLGMRTSWILTPLLEACSANLSTMSMVGKQEISCTLWALAKLGVSNATLTRPLAAACAAQASRMLPQEVANSLWALAKLEIFDPSLIHPLATAFVALLHKTNLQDVTNTMWVIGTLGIADEAIVRPVATLAAGKFGRSLLAQGAANCLLAAARVRLEDQSIIRTFAAACIADAGALTLQGAANCIWAAAVLDYRSEAFFRALLPSSIALKEAMDRADTAAAVAAAFPTAKALREDVKKGVAGGGNWLLTSGLANQLLYAHAATKTWLSPPLLSDEIVLLLRGVLRQWERSTRPYTIARSHALLLSSLARLGYVTKSKTEVLDGLMVVDAVIDVPVVPAVSSSSSGGSSSSVDGVRDGLVKVAFELDGPTHFLTWADPVTAAGDRRPLISHGGSCLRNRLLRAAGFRLAVIPFFEWSPITSDAQRDAYIVQRIQAAVAGELHAVEAQPWAAWA
jgi:hypothetical protein